MSYWGFPYRPDRNHEYMVEVRPEPVPGPVEHPYWREYMGGEYELLLTRVCPLRVTLRPAKGGWLVLFNGARIPLDNYTLLDAKREAELIAKGKIEEWLEEVELAIQKPLDRK
jgi:hypothetical protein